MPAPRLISDAERDLHRAVSAARALGASATAGLEQAEALMAEVRHFAYNVSDSKTVRTEDATRLLSAILGFKVEVRTVAAGLNELEGYARLAR